MNTHAPSFVIICALCLTLVSGKLLSAEAVWSLPDSAIPGIKIPMPLSVKNFGTIKKYIAPDIADAQWDQEVGSSRSSTSIINGRVNRESNFIFHITFHKEGIYTIPPFTLVNADGEKIATREARVRVSNAAVIAADKCYARITIVPDNIVAGEHFEIIYTVGTQAQKNIAISELGLSIPEGILDIGDEFNEKKRTEYDSNGQLWRVNSYHKKCTVSKSGEYIFSGQQSYGRVVRRGFSKQLQTLGTVAIKPATLTVNPLPHQGQPASFQGLVGKVTVVSALDRERISLGEGVQLQVRVSDGNIDLIGSVDLPDIPGFAIYTGDTEDAENSKTFTWSLVPKQEGMYIIPEISIPYYDPRGKRYRFASSESLALSVIPGRKRDLGMVGAPTHTSTRKNALSDSGLLLPAPVYGIGTRSLSSTDIWLGLLYGALGAGLLSLLHLCKRTKNTQREQLHKLIQALRTKDIQTANQSIHALLPHLTEHSQHAARSLQNSIEAARFGGDSALTNEDLIVQAQTLELR